MGATNTEQYTKKHNALASMVKALGHPAWIAIIEHFLKVERCICGDIFDELPLAQPRVSRHLKELKTAGLIKGSVDGNTICYCINNRAIESRAIETLQKYFTVMSDKLAGIKNVCCE